MDRRILVLPAAAIAIALLCAYKMTRTYPTQAQIAADISPPLKLAPEIELLDQNKPSEFVRLRRHLDHARVLVVFFDGEKGVAGSEVVLRLREEYSALKESGIEVLAVSTALPQQNRKAIEQTGPFPFPLLSDHDLSVHRAWGMLEEGSGRTATGVFLVDRSGRVGWSMKMDKPLPIAGAEQDIARLTQTLRNENRSPRMMP